MLRFVTVRDLYDAFPNAADDVGSAPGDEPSLSFLQSLATSQAWDKAISFCAYLLPRREAVWWGCQSLRRMRPPATSAEGAALDLAEAWVREPEEARRQAALAFGSQANTQLAAAWMALAAGWSGGSMLPPDHVVVRVAPDQTARAVRAGLMIALSRMPTEQIGPVMHESINNAAKLAMRGE